MRARKREKKEMEKHARPRKKAYRKIGVETKNITKERKKEKMENTDGEKRCRNNEVDTSREGKN